MEKYQSNHQYWSCYLVALTADFYPSDFAFINWADRNDVAKGIKCTDIYDFCNWLQEP